MITNKGKKQEAEKVLDVDASMQGTLVFKDSVNLRINGRFEGVLNTKGSLMIGEKAIVKADITGESIIVAGNVTGNITALKSLKIIAPAQVSGDIKSPSLSIAEGATFNGRSDMAAQGGSYLENLMNAEDLAKYLEIDMNLVHEWAGSGKLPGTRDNGNWRFERSKIDEWVAQGKIK
jgi:excisionase family DNA binding protein